MRRYDIARSTNREPGKCVNNNILRRRRGFKAAHQLLLYMLVPGDIPNLECVSTELLGNDMHGIKCAIALFQLATDRSLNGSSGPG